MSRKLSSGAEKDKAGKAKRIGQKVGTVVTIMMAISIFVCVAICAFLFKNLVMDTLEDQCIDGTNVLAYELSRASDDTDMTELVDSLKQYMGMEFTIFEGNTRAYTTVIQNGQRAVGTKVDSTVERIVLQEGKSYSGIVKVLGVNHVGSYVPVRDATGQITGLIFSGLSTSATMRHINTVVTLAAAAALLSIICCVLFLAAYLRKSVSAPLGELTQAALRLERGDLGLSSGEDIRITVHSNDEIGTLGNAFEAISHRLRAYIGEIDSVLDAISAGDLTGGTNQEYVGDFVSIRQSLNSIEDRLNETFLQIAESSGQVSGGASQVSNSAQSLAQGATEQASAVEELAATINDISNTARKTAAAAENARNAVDEAGRQVTASNEYVMQLNAAMDRISDSSEEIGKIIATIENIAFQTNILALNAAVEAARAGAAGKGFAVVADEVRNLASKSDQAAKATKELIENSVTAVADGAEVVGKVTESLQKATDLTSGVVDMMNGVAESVETQTSAITQVTEGIDQISAVVQTNSATSQECAAASEELSSQSSLLKELLSAFRLKAM